jgi:hypothetical protein
MLKTMCGAGYWPDGGRAERQDDDGPGEQPGDSLKDSLHVTSPLLQRAANVRMRRLLVLKGGFLRQHRQHRPSLSRTLLTVLTVFSSVHAS